MISSQVFPDKPRIIKFCKPLISAGMVDDSNLSMAHYPTRNTRPTLVSKDLLIQDIITYKTLLTLHVPQRIYKAREPMANTEEMRQLEAPETKPPFSSNRAQSGSSGPPVKESSIAHIFRFDKFVNSVGISPTRLLETKVSVSS